MIEPGLRALLRQGERAARLGKQQAAEEVYRSAVEQFPDSARAWLGLSQVVASEEERESALERARELDAELVDSFEQPAEPEPDTPGDASVADSSDQAEAEPAADQVEEVEAAVPAPREQEAAAPEEAESATQLTTCFYHPARETTLRCNRCEKPICARCAVNTPVGYRCKSCINEQQETFYSALWYDYAVAAAVTLPLAAVASFLVLSIGWMTIFVAPFAGSLIAEGVRLATRRRRGRWLPLVVGLCIAAGSLPAVGVWLIRLVVEGLPARMGSVGLGSLVWQLVYLALAVSSAYYRLK